MKTWKHADWIIQTALFTFGIVYILLKGLHNTSFFLAYFILGGWQVLSSFVNMVWKKGQWLIAARKTYLISLFFVIGLGVIIYLGAYRLGEIAVIYLISLLYLAPLLALWYITICYREWKLIRTKEFMHLK